MVRIAPHHILRWVTARTPIALVLSLTLLVFGSASCDVHGVSPPGTLASVSLLPSASLLAQSTTQLVAVGRDAEGRIVPISPTWAIVASGGSVNATGLFTAGPKAGVFTNTIEVTVGDIVAFGSVTIIAGPLASITVAPANAVFAVGTGQQFVAIGFDAAGNTVPLAPTWSVVAGGGTIDVAGNFVAGSTPGVYQNSIQASNNGVIGLTTVTVTVGPLASIVISPNPDTLAVRSTKRFVATGRDARGNPIDIVASWQVAEGGGTIDGAGVFTAGPVPGTFANTIVATSGDQSATATVVVTAGALATIRVLPNPLTLAIGGVQQFAASGSDAAGNPVAITPVWAMVSGGGTVDASGRFTAGTVAGTFVNAIRATAAGIAGTATVIVTTGPLASITVTPNPVYIQAHTNQAFTAVGRDAGGNVFVLAPVWSVTSGGGVINAGTGVFTAGATPGTFTGTVQASSNGVTGTATVIVTAAPVVGLVTTFEDFSVGPIDGQHDWKSLGGLNAPLPVNPADTHCKVYDHEIANNAAPAVTYTYSAFQRHSLRISNAVTSGCYGDQTFSNRTPNYAGQTGSWTRSKNGLIDYSVAGGVVQNHFEAEWSFASAVPDAEQPGLEVVVSPGRGDDSRMSWVQMADRPSGLAVIFAERSNPASAGAFQLTTVAQGLDRRLPHAIKLTMDFVDGPGNDIVRVFVDGTLMHTGTSWENYYFYDVGGRANFGGNSPVVNRLMFRTGSDLARGIPGTPAPATLGFGFLFDNVRQATLTVPAAANARVRP